MTPERFDKLTKETLQKCKETLAQKEAEYSSGKDRFHNFNVGARIKNITPLQALEGMKLKHDVSVQDLFDNPDSATFALLDAKINDSINYLLLARGLFVEHIEAPKRGTLAPAPVHCLR